MGSTYKQNGPVNTLTHRRVKMDAYEIRLELLKLAQGIESERVWSDRNRLEQDWNARIEQARENLQKEIAGKNFETVEEETKQQWENYLSRIELEGATKKQKGI